jgi:hypothetical protein
MYWRVQKVGPEQLIKSYGVHILLILSICANGVLWLSRPQKTMPNEVKQDIETFVRQVTNHLLDTSYLSCELNMTALRGELDPPLARNLTQQGILPKDSQDMHALVMDMAERKQICAVRIDKIQVGEPNQRGLIPVGVQGVCAIHSAAETAERAFTFQYLIGQHPETKAFLIADYKDLTPPDAGGGGAPQ